MNNRFSQFHPLVTFIYYVGALSLVMLLLHPIYLLLALVVIFAINFNQDRGRGLRRWFLFMITSGLLILLLNPIFNQRGRHILFELFGRPFTLEAVTYAGMTALSIIAVIALFVSYNEVMTPNKLLYLFSRFLPQFAILLMLTLRFIPLMRRRLEEISAIQMSKGITVLQGKWRDRIKAGLLYVQVLLTYSLEEAIQTADSMMARGYGQGKRSTYEHFRLSNTDWIALSYLVIVFISIIYSRFSGLGLLTIYPNMESMKLEYLDTILLTIYLLYLAFPLFVEIGGRLRWRLLN
jgi:energy-coupling factor transport system permease protein